MFVNGFECIDSGYLFNYHGTVLPLEHAFLFDMKFDDHIHGPEWFETVKNNEWNHVKLKWEISYFTDPEEDAWSSTEEGEKEIKT